MEKLYKFVRNLDILIDSFIKGFAIYLIFWQKDYFHATIVLGMSGLWCLSMVAERLLNKKD